LPGNQARAKEKATTLAKRHGFPKSKDYNYAELSVSQVLFN
jgi:hypothetical protein